MTYHDQYTSHGIAALSSDEMDNADTEANAVEILRSLWTEARTQAFQEWRVGVSEHLQSAQVLRPALHGSGHGGQGQKVKRSKFSKTEREARRALLFALWTIQQTPLCASCGRKSTEQQSEQLTYLVRRLPPPFAFAQFRSTHRTTKILQVLLEACNARWLVLRPSRKTEEVRRSVTDKKKGRLSICSDQLARASISPLFCQGVKAEAAA